MYEELLEGIGLTRGEIIVYETLLKIGESTTGSIIEESGLASSKIYEILDKLMKKGLVVYIIKGKIKYFSAASPKRILDYVKQKETELKKKEEQLQSIIPGLIRLQEERKEEYSARIYKDIDGWKAAIHEAMEEAKKGDEWLAMAVAPKEPQKTINRIWKHWHAERARKNIHCKMLVSDEAAFTFLQAYKKIEVRLTKALTAASISVIGNKVLIYTWKDVSALVITNEEIAQTFKALFYGLWTLAKP